MKRPKCRNTEWLVLLGGIAAACGAAPMPQAAQTPQLVAAFPRSTAGGGSSVAAADGPVVRETIYLVLEASDPDEAAEKAARMAYGSGGYETNRYAWYADGGRTVSQELFVPLDQSGSLHARLLQLGWRKTESVVRHPEDSYSPGFGWAQFAIQFLPARPTIAWDGLPHRPFLQAICGFAVAAAVLAKLAAAFVLAVVVVVPCGLMIVGAVTSVRWLIRR
jgi:hypothetical protein